MIFYSIYNFDYKAFFSFLEEKVAVDGIVEPDKLHVEATRLHNTFGRNEQSILEKFRFDEDWFDNTDYDTSKSIFLFNIFLVKFLKPFPSIDVTEGFSYLKHLLEELQWNDKDIHMLLYGNPLHTLIGKSKNPAVVEEFHSGIDQFGGWIDIEDIEYLLSLLTKKSLNLTKINNVIHSSNEILMYENITKILENTFNTNKALFIITD